MAVSSARGYIAVQRQSAFGTPGDMITPAPIFYSYRNAPRAGGEVTNNRYRESASGLDVGLSLKEGIQYMADFPLLARPVTIASLLQHVMGPAAGGALANQVLGGGWMSNGLVRPPKPAGGGGNSTLAVLRAGTGAENTLTVASATGFGNADKVAIGWGPNLEFVTLHASAAVAGAVLTLAVGTFLKFPHAVGEPVVEVAAYAQLAANYTTGTALTFGAGQGTGFVNGDTIAVSFMANAGFEGSEFGSAEEKLVTTFAGDLATVLSSALSNKHSIGAWVYVVDTTVTASRIHCFEPVSALGRTCDYFSVERAVSNILVERMSDAKAGNFEVSGESPGPLEISMSYKPRLGSPYINALTDTYPNQGADDVPFRMPDGKFVLTVGASTTESTQMRQFALAVGNDLLTDLYTDDIVSADILQVSRQANLQAQFYFSTKASYMEFMYGNSAPSDGAAPSRLAATGVFLASFQIDASKRVSIFIPRVVWEAYPVNTDAEPKAIVVEAVGAPLKLSGRPMILVAVQNADTAVYA